MRTNDATSPNDVRAHRRWLIGLTITVVFGMFGAVMALLAYNNTLQPAARARPGASRPKTAPATTPPAAATPAPTPPVVAPAASAEPAKDETRGKKHERE